MKTKPHGILVALIYLFPLIYLFLQKRRVPVKYVVVIAVILFVGFGRVVADIARGGQVIPEIGQFNEMPPLSIDGYMVHLKNVLVQSYRLILPWYWGVFRWLSLTYPRLVHRVINVITLVGLAGLLMFMRQIFSECLKGSQRILNLMRQPARQGSHGLKFFSLRDFFPKQHILLGHFFSGLFIYIA